MTTEFVDSLIAYVALLMEKGFKTIHTYDVLPPRNRTDAPFDWTQFPSLDCAQTYYLYLRGISYDYSSGTFRKAAV